MEFHDSVVMDNNLVSSADMIKSGLLNSRFCFNVGHVNIRSITAHFDQLVHTLDITALDVLGISETFLRSNTPAALFRIPGYNFFRCDRVGKKCGGVGIYIKVKHKAKVLRKSIAGAKIEFVAIEICMRGGKLLVCCLYNPPPVTSRDADDICNIFSDLVSYNSRALFMGDFNFNMLDTRNSFAKILSDISFEFIPFAPTRESAVLDTFIMPKTEYFRVLKYGQETVTNMADHDFIFMSYNFRPAPTPNKFVECRCFKSINHGRLLQDAMSQPWQLLWNMTDCNSQVEFFNSSILHLFNQHVPVKKRLEQDPLNPWMTLKILKRIALRDQARKVWKRSRDSRDHVIFLKIRNEVTHLIKSAKCSFYKNKLDPSQSSSKLWRNLKSMGIVNTKASGFINHSADNLNQFFTNTSRNSVAIPLPDINTIFSNDFSFSCVDKVEVMSAIYLIKSNAIGTDGISLKFLKLILPVVLPYLTHIYNHCLTTSSFPSLWKCALVTPVPKKDEAVALNDYRPISILPVLSKGLETLIKRQLEQYIEANNYFSVFQSGFRSYHSTTTALLKISDDIVGNLDSGKFTILTLLDFSKAFDTINHLVLLQKLKLYYGFSDSAVLLLYSYLTERFQSVKIGDDVSTLIHIVDGVPQGSILGPLLFALFINDLPRLLACNYHLYADDLQIYRSGFLDELNTVFASTNNDLHTISLWSKSNGLSLNCSKTQCLFIFKRLLDIVLPPLYLDNNKLTLAMSVRNLGLIFNRTLTWSDQISAMSNKINYALYTLKLTKDLLPLNLRLKLVQTLILPLFAYCDIIFYNCGQESKRILQLAFNNCVRYVFNLGMRDHVSPYAESIIGCKLQTYYEFHVACFIYRILSSRKPDYLFRLFYYGSSSRTMVLKFPAFSCQQRQRSFFVHGVSYIWNSIPISIRSLNSFQAFKTQCFAFLTA